MNNNHNTLKSNKKTYIASKPQRLILAALFAALTAIGAFYKIPAWPVSFSLQLMFAVMAGMLLGPRLGTASQAVYVCLGIIGMPVFTEGGGPSYVLKPSFGYILGFVAAAFIAGLVQEKLNAKKGLTFLTCLCAAASGSLACYIVGVPYMFIILNFVASKTTSMTNVLLMGFVVFIPAEVAKILVTSWLLLSVSKRLRFMRSPG